MMCVLVGPSSHQLTSVRPVTPPVLLATVLPLLTVPLVRLIIVCLMGTVCRFVDLGSIWPVEFVPVVMLIAMPVFRALNAMFVKLMPLLLIMSVNLLPALVTVSPVWGHNQHALLASVQLSFQDQLVCLPVPQALIKPPQVLVPK